MSPLAELNETDNPWVNGTKLASFRIFLLKFHFVLNVAVGGYYFKYDCVNANHPKPWNPFSSAPALDFWAAPKINGIQQGLFLDLI